MDGMSSVPEPSVALTEQGVPDQGLSVVYIVGGLTGLTGLYDLFVVPPASCVRVRSRL